MNTRTILYSALLLMVFSIDAFAVKTGDVAPDFKLKGSDGKEHSLSAQKGKVVVLEWLNHGCPFVQKHYHEKHKNMQALQKKYTGKEVVWYSIISSAEGKQGYSTPEKAESDKKEKGSVASAVLLDPTGAVGRMYNAKTTPHMYIVDPEGKLRYQGAIDDNPSSDYDDIPGAKQYVAMALDWVLTPAQARSKTQPFPGSTKPYGCSVKY